MRLPWALVLAALLGVAQAEVVGRQQDDSSASEGTPTSASTPTPAPPDTTSASPPSPDTSTTVTDGGGGNDGDNSSSSGGGGGGGSDTTVFQTKTVTSGGGSGGKTITDLTTLVTTSTTTVVVTSTAFSTTTVTSRDQDTATKVVFETKTEFVNKKRGLDAWIVPRTVPTEVHAVPTATAVPVADVAGQDLQLRGAQRRAVITQVVTVTVTVGGGGKDTTVVDSVVKTALATKTAETTITNVITMTEQANAKTTITSTSTLTVTSTVVTTGVVQTITETQTNSPSSSAGSGSTGDNNGGKGNAQSPGLSTGAKAGIGVGAGLGGLAAVAALLWFVLRRRNSGLKPDPDDLVGASEVPVGGPGGRGGTPMSGQSAGAAGLLAPGRSTSKPAEGYRGTALGDGRAGYAKPAYGPTFTPSPATTMQRPSNPGSPGAYDRRNMAEIGLGAHAEAPPAAELSTDGGHAARWHAPNASEIDGNAVVNRQSGPVYEMPTGNYR